MGGPTSDIIEKAEERTFNLDTITGEHHIYVHNDAAIPYIFFPYYKITAENTSSYDFMAFRNKALGVWVVTLKSNPRNFIRIFTYKTVKEKNKTVMKRASSTKTASSFGVSPELIFCENLRYLTKNKILFFKKTLDKGTVKNPFQSRQERQVTYLLILTDNLQATSDQSKSKCFNNIFKASALKKIIISPKKSAVANKQKYIGTAYLYSCPNYNKSNTSSINWSIKACLNIYDK